jgi:hypothetical protein
VYGVRLNDVDGGRWCCLGFGIGEEVSSLSAGTLVPNSEVSARMARVRRRELWMRKLRRNAQRDGEVDRVLETNGRALVPIWAHESPSTADRVELAVRLHLKELRSRQQP